MILNDATPERVLLDTCAIIYVFNGEAMAENAMDAVDGGSTVFVSPISAWEIGVLARKSGPARLLFSPDPKSWFRRVLDAPGVSAATFDADIALASCSLPEPLHRDPADRFLIATARKLAIPIVTRDRLILAYSDAGHVDAIPC